MVLKAITAPLMQGGFLLPKFNNERVVSDKVQRVFYTQITPPEVIRLTFNRRQSGIKIM